MGLQRALTDFGAEESFEKASQRLFEHYRVKIGGSSIRRITESHAEAMSFELETEVVMPALGVKQLIAETDGSFVPIVEMKSGSGDNRKRRECVWREARLCLAGQVGEVNRRYRATLGSPNQAGLQWRAAVVQAGGGKNTQIHCVADGAPWIATQVKEQFGAQAIYLLDFYHVSEYLSDASKTVAGDAAYKWLKLAQEKMKSNDVEWVLCELRKHLEAKQVSDKDAPVRRLVRYIEARLEYLDYARAIERGLPIGSGEIESSHRTVIQKRLKIAGAWWKKENAEKMLGLRCVRANQEWASYWKAVRQANA